MKTISMLPIGVVRCTRVEASDDDWDKEQVRIELDASRFGEDALAGLADFSHVEVVFHFDRADPSKIELTARHPRNNPEWPKVGIFAQRAKNRPNRIGTTICRLRRVEGLTIHVEGLDAIDGTPVLDIKPWVREFGPRCEASQPAWISELMRDYWR